MFYVVVAFSIAYGSSAAGLGIPREDMLMAVLISSVVQIPVLFISGAYSDRHGRRGIYMLGALLIGFWAFVMFPLIDTGNFLWIVFSLCVGQIFISMSYGPQAAFLAELFATHVRYSGASLGYQCGSIFGGALAPIIATALWSSTGSTLGISVYIALTCGLTIGSVWLLSETSGTNLDAAVAVNE